MGPVALLVFKTSEPANNGLVGSTPTRLRQSLSVSVHGNMSRLDHGLGIIRRRVRPIVLSNLLRPLELLQPRPDLWSHRQCPCFIAPIVKTGW